MSFETQALIFLGTVAAISVTGVMMPGPVTAATIAKGYKDRMAGIHIAIGHGIVEFPTIALMAMGFSGVLQNTFVSIGIGIVGGAMLIFMGITMIMSRGGVFEKLKSAGTGTPDDAGALQKKEMGEIPDPFPYHPVVAGVMTTATNPYYFLWWATLGSMLVFNALGLGLAVLVALAFVHWSIDLGWYAFIGMAVNRSRTLWDRKVYIAVFSFCGAVMIFFGGWFLGAAILGVADFTAH